MAQGETFKPGEPYTHRLSKILEEYPDGSQIIREILQNSDDAKSSSQVFILDRNFYQSNNLLKPVKKSDKTNLKLDRYQGPALLAKNDTIFEERDFDSLKKLANSEKYDQFDKIGVQLITGDNFLILDPHENYFDGGIKIDFVKNNLAALYPDQFAPFRVPCDQKFKGSLFRYPLRTAQDALESEISKKAYSPDQILEMFQTFYENESINCLLFLKYIESIEFYELGENETELKLLYSIEIVNPERIRAERRKIAESIGPMMDSLTKKKNSKITALETAFIAEFRRKRGDDDPQVDQWIIFTWLDDLNAAENYFQNNFKKSISTYKFIPNVGIALPLNDTWAKFLVRLPIEVPRINKSEFYDFWPIVQKSISGSSTNFFERLLLSTVENLNIDDEVFCGPSVSYALGNVVEISQKSFTSHKTEFHLLSIDNGYFPDEYASDEISKIVGSIGFPVINIKLEVKDALKKSQLKNSLKFFSPQIIRKYLHKNKAKWENQLSRKEKLSLLSYILEDKSYIELDGLSMIPLANKDLGNFSKNTNCIIYIGPDKDQRLGINDERNIFKNSLSKFIDKDIPHKLWNQIFEGTKSGWCLNVKILTATAMADLITKSLEGYTNTIDEIPLKNSREWINQIWYNFLERQYNLDNFKDIHLLPTNRGTLRKIRTVQKCFWNSIDNKLENKIQPLIEKFGIVFVDKEFEKHDQNLNSQEANELIDYLCRHFRPSNTANYGLIIKHLPIFSEVDKDELIALMPGTKEWYLLPTEDEKSYGHIIAPTDVNGFLDATMSSSRFLMENIIKISRLSQQEYWCKFVIPYLEYQPTNVLKIVITKLFERLMQLLSGDSKLKSILEKTAFVPSGSIQSQPNDSAKYELHKPIDLYDPDNWKISELFFDDEIVFPIKNIADYKHRILPLLRELGMKTYLSLDDIIQRLKIMNERKEISNLREIVHKKSMKLVQYIDLHFDKLIGGKQQFRSNNVSTNNNSQLQQLSMMFLSTEWLPTIDHTGKQRFSKPEDCRDKQHKNTVGLIMPILEYSLNNKSFSTLLRWNSYPPVDIVLRQLKACNSQSRDQLYKYHQKPDKICESIYKYMNEALSARDRDQQSRMEVEKFKELLLKEENWIFCNDRFYPSSRVVFELDDSLISDTSVIIQLPPKYKLYYSDLFSEMGVRQRVEIPDLINIIREFHKDGKTLLHDEIHKVIVLIEQIAKKRADSEQLGNNDNSLKGLLIPSTECQLVDFYDIQYDDMGNRLEEEKKREYKIAHPQISSAVARMLGMQELTGKLIDEARRLCLVIDEGEFGIPKKLLDQKSHSLITEEMNDWQGPALWIFNDAVFTEKDFESLLKLGVGGKSKDHSKIGKFGIGINVSFHLTDLISFVSGEYIAFLDPSERFLPKTGNPPRRPRGKRINFLKSDFKNRFKDQAKPYTSTFKECNFTEKFNGTLFRIPLRKNKMVESSKISTSCHDARDVLQIFEAIVGNQEILFLRNIEHCSLQYYAKDKSKKLIWEVKIENMDSQIRENEKSKFLEDNWNKHILFEILPQLHVALLNHVAELDNQYRFPKFQQERASRHNQYNAITTTSLWPVVDGLSEIYKKYAIKVLRNLYYGNSKICWTQANGGRFISFRDAYLEERKNTVIAEILAAQNIPIIKLTDEQISHFNDLRRTDKGKTIEPLKKITAQLVSETFRSNPNILNGGSHENIFKLLKFIIQDKDLSHESLIGLTLLPLSNGTTGTFGEREHYIAEPKLQELFPTAVERSKFVAEYPKDLKMLFNDEKFCTLAKIKRVNASSIISLLEYELPRDKELDWNQNGPNQQWINNILRYFIPPNASYDFSKFARLPLLPIIRPQEKLALFDFQNPALAYEASHPMTSIIAKFGVRFTTLKFPESLGKSAFISAQSGILIPQDLPLFTEENSKVFSAESEDDYSTLFALEVQTLDSLKYVKENLIPYIIDLGPTIQCLELLKSIILLKNRDIEDHLALQPIIPNNSLTKLAKANELYDANNYLFLTSFNESDRFLHSNLLLNPECFEAVKRMGLNYKVNSQNFLECAREIELKINNNITNANDSSLNVIRYLYENYSKMRFSKKQWEELITIKFIPVDLDLPYPYAEHAAKITTEFESFDSLRCQIYKNLCWTQCTLFSKFIDPPKPFLDFMLRETGHSYYYPPIVEIIKNLMVIALEIPQSPNYSSWKSSDGVKTLLEILGENYYTLNHFVENSNDTEILIKDNIKDAKLFLNNDDPFNSNSWVAGRDIVFGVDDDDLRKVHPFLKNYKKLLKAVGAKELENVSSKVKVRKHSQKDELLKKLLENFRQQEEIKHDVVFRVGENNTGIEDIYANRYVLSAASQHFDMLLNESLNDPLSQKIIVEIEGQPSAFRILIRWLYGQPFKEAFYEVFNSNNNNSIDNYSLLIGIIKLSNRFDLDPLKELAEKDLIEGPYINIKNVLSIKQLAQINRAFQLQTHCEKYIKTNEELF
ncbi:15918_t:CDS:2 [Racocetra fulgida]|uniref:15918_t:CDS:1 n=1 Tax=Racocetra fulgida TaxID=60492 RepID=A0A9N8WFE4_9GLOM|nr:15918_t:CDS:2 [Racocetra fulgida]